MDKAKVQRHIDHLQEQHDLLDKEIELQIRDYGEDALVQSLKKRKLKLKDEIESFKIGARP